MSVAFRSLSSVAYGNQPDISIAPPAGIADSDLLLLVHLYGCASPPAPPVTIPAGFTLLDGFPYAIAQAGTAFEVQTRIAWKIAASESGDYVFVHNANPSEAVMLAFSGAKNAAPDITMNHGDGIDGTNGQVSTALSITTHTADALVAFIAHNWELYGGASPPTGTTPTFTERLDSHSNLTYVATGILAASGATGDKTHANLNALSEAWSAFLVEVQSAASGFHATPYYSMIGSNRNV